MEDILAVIFVCGGGMAFLLAVSPVGRAYADRLRHGPQPLPGADTDPAVWEELDRLRGDVAELQERVDFAERLLAKGTETAIREDAREMGS